MRGNGGVEALAKIQEELEGVISNLKVVGVHGVEIAPLFAVWLSGVHGPYVKHLPGQIRIPLKRLGRWSGRRGDSASNVT